MKKTLELIIEKCRNKKITYLYVTCTRFDAMPYDFYIRFGFEDTQRVEEKEQVLKFKV